MYLQNLQLLIFTFYKSQKNIYIRIFENRVEQRKFVIFEEYM